MRKELIGKRFFKYWPKKHVDNALEHGIIRLGSFWGYQEIEKKESQDKNEGHPGLAFEVMEDMKMPAKLFNQLVAEGPLHQQYKLNEPWKIDIKKGTSITVNSPFNFPMFCLSTSEEIDFELMNEFGKPDPDVFEILDYQKFTYEVAKQVLKELMNTKIHQKHGSLDKLDKNQYEVEARSDIVQYLEKERMVIPVYPDKELEFDRVINGMEFFRKHEQFSFQREFRVVVMTKVAGNLATVHGEPITIKLDNPNELIRRPVELTK